MFLNKIVKPQARWARLYYMVRQEEISTKFSPKLTKCTKFRATQNLFNIAIKTTKAV